MPWNPFSRKTPPTSKDAFEDLVRRAAGRIGAQVTQYTPDSVVLSWQGQQKTAGLGNIRPRVMGLPEPDRGPALEFFLKAVVQVRDDLEPASLDDVRARLMPRIGPPLAPSENPPASIPLVPGHLDVNIVVDEETTLSYVHQSHLDRWQAKAVDLYPIALENLRRQSSSRNWQTFPQAPGVLFYVSGDSYDASRLLILNDLVSPWPPAGVLAGVPFRDMLMSVPLDGIRALKTVEGAIPILSGAYVTEGYKISDQLFWMDGERWEVVPIEYAKEGVRVKVLERLTRSLERLGAQEGARNP